MRLFVFAPWGLEALGVWGWNGRGAGGASGGRGQGARVWAPALGSPAAVEKQMCISQCGGWRSEAKFRRAGLSSGLFSWRVDGDLLPCPHVVVFLHDWV